MASAAGTYTVMVRISAAQAKKDLAGLKASLKGLAASTGKLQGSSVAIGGSPTQITEQAAALELLGPAARNAAKSLNVLSKANTAYAASATEAAAAHELFDHATRDADKTALKIGAQAAAMKELGVASKGYATNMRTAAGGQERLNRAMAGSTMASAGKKKQTFKESNWGQGAFAERTGKASMPNSVDAQIRNTRTEATKTVDPMAALTTATRAYAGAARTAATQANRLATAMSAIGFGAPGATKNTSAAANAAAASAAATALQVEAATASSSKATRAVSNATKEAAGEVMNFDQRLAANMSTLRSHGASMNWAGRQVSMFFTAPIALAGAAAFKWQMDAEKAATQLAKVYDGSMSDIETSINGAAPSWNDSPMDRYLTALGEKMAMSRAETIDMAADWAAIGVQGTQLASAARLTTEAMVLGDMDAAQATEALVAIQSQYALAFGDFNTEMERAKRISEGSVEAMREQEAAGTTLTGVLAQLNMVENQTAANMQDLVLAFSRSASQARAAGVEAEQLAAHVAALVPATGTAERAGNALKTIYQSLGADKSAKQVNAMEALATNAGLSADAFLNAEFRARGMGDGIEEIARAYAQLSGPQRMQWAGDTFGIYQMVRGMQLLEDVSVGVGDTTFENGKSMKMLASQFGRLETEGQKAAFVMREFGAEGIEAGQIMDHLSTLAGQQAEGLSYYQKALERSDPSQVYQQYQDELNKVLESNPAMFKRALVVLQNAMQRMIVPLLPILLNMANSVAALAKKFGELSPQAQKFIAVSLLVVAAIGPIAMMVGSMYLLISVTGKFFTFAKGLAESFLGIGKGARNAVGGVSRLAGVMRRRRGGGGAAGALGGGTDPRGPRGGGGGLFGGRGSKATPSPGALAFNREAMETSASAQVAATGLGRVDRELREIVISAAAATSALDARTKKDAASAGTAVVGDVPGGKDGGKDKKGGGKKSALITGASTAGGMVGADLILPKGFKRAAQDAEDASKKVGKLGTAAKNTGNAAEVAAGGVKLGKLENAIKVAPDAIPKLKPGETKVALDAGKSAGEAAKKGVTEAIVQVPEEVAKAGGKSGAGFVSRFMGALGKIAKIGGPIALALGAVDMAMRAFAGTNLVNEVKAMFAGVSEVASAAMNDGGVPVLAKPFVAAGEVISQVLSNFPKVVRSVFEGVLNTIQRIMEAIYRSFSFMNPFARHSPSLVENVTNGMAIVGDEFAAAGDRISSVMHSAYSDISAFGTKTAGLRLRAEDIEISENRGKIAEHAPDALPEFDRLVSAQRELQRAYDALTPRIREQERAVDAAQAAVDAYDKTIEQMSRSVELAERRLDVLNKGLDKARDSYDRYANATISGMGAVDDAMFANEMAQKRLQLAMKNAGADDLGKTEDALARIQGQMDDMRATRESLRLGGAGSEILSVYDSQLSGLSQEREGLSTGPSSEIQRMQEELDKLQQQAEKMDLERALKFDPLTRQIEQFTNKAEELPFGTIMAGLQSSGAQVDAYEGRIESLTEQIDRQRDAITAVEDLRYAAQQTLDVEQEKLDGLTTAQSELNDTMSAISEAISLAVQSVDAYTQSLEEAKAAADALSGSGAGADGYDLGAGIDSELPGGSFSGFDEGGDLEKMIEDMEKAFQFDFDLLGPIKRAWENVVNWFKNLDWGVIATEIVRGISYLAGYLVGLVGRIATQLWDVATLVVDLMASFGEGIVEWFKNVDWAQTWSNLTSGEWWQGVWDEMYKRGGEIVSGVWEGIKNGASASWDWIWENVVTPMIDGFKKGFGIESPAKEMMPIGVDILLGLLQGIKDTVIDVLEWAWNFVLQVVDAIKTNIGLMWDTGVEFIRNLYEGILNKIEDVWTWARGVGGTVVEKIKEGLSTLWEVGRDIVDGIWKGISDAASDLWENVKGFGSSIIGKLREGVDAHSPSRDAMEVGGDIGDGLVLGLEAAAGRAHRAAMDLSRAALPEAPSAPAAVAAAPAAAAAPTESPLAGMAVDAQQNMGQVAAAVSGAATQMSADYLATTGQMRLTEAAAQQGFALATSAIESGRATAIVNSVSNMATAVGTQTTTMAATVTAQTATMSANSISSSTSMAAGVISAGTSMASGVISAGASMEAGLAGSMSRMSANVSDVINGQVAPIIGSIDPMLQAMTGWFDASVNNVGTIWSGIQPKTADPARFVINEVYNNGLRTAWNNFNEFLDLPALPAYTANFRDGGAVDFRNGGTVIGPGTGTSDSIPARLSNGEHVITAREVQRAGGHGVIERQRAQWIRGTTAAARRKADQSYAFANGGPVQFFRDGGPVVDQMPPMKGSEGGLKINAIRAGRAVSLKFPEVQTIGGYRASDPYPDHPSGRALDIMVGSLALGDAIKDYLFANNSKFYMEYALWRQAQWTSGSTAIPMEDRGNLTQNHYDHVHAYFADGPYPPPGFQYGGIPIGTPMLFGGGGASVNYADLIGDSFDQAMSGIKDPGFGGAIGQWVPKSIEKVNLAKDFMAKKAEEMNAFLGTINDADGLVERWRPMVIQALKRNGFEPSLRNQNLMLAQIQSESSGIPNKVQEVVDVNTGGNEAVGLLQIAKGTWPGVRDPSLPDDRTDPWANMNAALRYYKGKYGMDLGTMWGQGHGYDNGGVLPPTPGGFSTYYNHTGRPEVVLTAQQWAAIYRAASMAPESISAAAAAAAAAAVELVSDADEPWKGAILGQTEAIAASLEEQKTPWDEFKDTLTKIGEVLTKAATFGQTVSSAVEATRDAIAAADERILEQAAAAQTETEAITSGTDSIVSEVSGVTDEVAKLTTDLPDSAERVADAVEEVVENTRPETFSEALERLGSEASAQWNEGTAKLGEIFDYVVNSGDLQGGVARLEQATAHYGAEANRLAAETIKLLGDNIEATAAIVTAWVPVADALYDMFAALPAAESRNLGSWATYRGPQNVMESMDMGITGVWNTTSSLLNLAKDTLPSLLKHGVGIGSKLLNFVAENGDAVAAIGVAIATGNIAAVLPFIPKILAGLLELLPMIIEAIVEIVPNLIKGLFTFIQNLLGGQFQVYSYKTVDDAAKAVNDNTRAIREGTFVPGADTGGTIERSTTSSQTIVFNGDLSFPSVQSGDDAKSFLTNVQTLSGR